MSKKYNHAFSFSFSVDSDASCDSDNDYPTPSEVRSAIVNHLCAVDDSEIMENIGVPFDTIENDNE